MFFSQWRIYFVIKTNIILFKFLGELSHKHKIVVAGNHELSFDLSFVHLFKQSSLSSSKNSDSPEENAIPTLGMHKDDLNNAVNVENVKKYLTNCTYLEDNGIELFGIKIFGSPW